MSWLGTQAPSRWADLLSGFAFGRAAGGSALSSRSAATRRAVLRSRVQLALAQPRRGGSREPRPRSRRSRTGFGRLRFVHPRPGRGLSALALARGTSDAVAHSGGAGRRRRVAWIAVFAARGGGLARPRYRCGPAGAGCSRGASSRDRRLDESGRRRLPQRDLYLPRSSAVGQAGDVQDPASDRHAARWWRVGLSPRRPETKLDGSSPGTSPTVTPSVPHPQGHRDLSPEGVSGLHTEGGPTSQRLTRIGPCRSA